MWLGEGLFMINRIRRICVVLSAVAILIMGTGYAATVYDIGSTVYWDSKWKGDPHRSIRLFQYDLLNDKYYIDDLTATCTEPGRVAVRCSTTHSSPTTGYTCNAWTWVNIAALGHRVLNYTENNDATCMNNGTKTGTCVTCGEAVTVEIEGTKKTHSYTNYVPDGNANCTDPGTETALCDYGCKTEDVRPGEINPDNHVWDLWKSNGDDTHTRICALNSEHTTQTDVCHGGTATVHKRAVCEDCGAEYGMLLTALPETGDDAQLMVFAFMLLAGAMGLIVQKRKIKA